jgi:hypothetical protein
VQARWYTEANRTSFDHVVLHTMEFWERGDSAEWCQHFFATSDRKGSTHMCVDNNSIARSVLDKDVCWGANGVNRSGLHIEHAGFASQDSASWWDDYSMDMLWLSAQLTAAWCKKYSIPATFVDWRGLIAGHRGITTHAEAEKAFPYGGHTDPGAAFPIDTYVDNVRFILDPPIATKEVHMFMLQAPAGINDGVFLVDVTTIRWIESGHEVGVLNAAGVPTVTATEDKIRVMRDARTPFGPSPTSGPFVGFW